MLVFVGNSVVLALVSHDITDVHNKSMDSISRGGLCGYEKLRSTPHAPYSTPPRGSHSGTYSRPQSCTSVYSAHISPNGSSAYTPIIIWSLLPV